MKIVFKVFQNKEKERAGDRHLKRMRYISEGVPFSAEIVRNNVKRRKMVKEMEEEDSIEHKNWYEAELDGNY